MHGVLSFRGAQITASSLGARLMNMRATARPSFLEHYATLAQQDARPLGPAGHKLPPLCNTPAVNFFPQASLSSTSSPPRIRKHAFTIYRPSARKKYIHALNSTFKEGSFVRQPLIFEELCPGGPNMVQYFNDVNYIPNSKSSW